MNNKKIIELLLSVQMDDLNDAEMLAHYAHEIQEAGDADIARAIATRAKARLAQMQDCKRTVEIVMQRIIAEDNETTDELYKELFEKYIEKNAGKVKAKLECM